MSAGVGGSAGTGIETDTETDTAAGFGVDTEHLLVAATAAQAIADAVGEVGRRFVGAAEPASSSALPGGTAALAEALDGERRAIADLAAAMADAARRLRSTATAYDAADDRITRLVREATRSA